MRSAQVLGLSLVISAAVAQQQYRPGASGGFGGGGSAGFGAGGGGGGFNDGAVGDGGDSTGSLEENIPGIPGDDYPIFAEVPDTSFLCDGQIEGGYYADVEAECQVFHICGNDGNGGLTKYSFLCPNGTLFNQQYFVCDWWFNVDCSLAEQFWTLNEEVAAARAANTPAEAGGEVGGPVEARRGQQGKRGGAGGGRRGGAQASASSLRGSYSAPDTPADSGLDTGYAAPPLTGYGTRRRNARGLELQELQELAGEDFDY